MAVISVLKQETAYKTAQIVKDTVDAMKTMEMQFINNTINKN
jgi:hypothetical protein